MALVAAACGDGGGRGAALYRANCASCHAVDGSGATGPRIGGGATIEAYTVDEMIDLVSGGRNGMPTSTGRLGAPEVAAVVECVRGDLGIIDGSAEPAE